MPRCGRIFVFIGIARWRHVIARVHFAYSACSCSTEGGDGAQESEVVFETESAAKTALLLTNAMIVDRPIEVAPLNEPSHPDSAQMPSDEIQQKNFNVEDAARVRFWPVFNFRQY